jgi:hypothetical protein
MNSIVLNLGGRQFGKSAFLKQLLDVYLDAGRTVAVCYSHGIEVHKRKGHLTAISTLPYRKPEECSAKP